MNNNVTISQLKNIVHRLHERNRLADLSIYVSGPPGIGKSALFHQLADELKAKHEVYLACTMDPTDVSGVPYPIQGQGVTRFLPPERLLLLTEYAATPPPFTVACFDDLPACPDQVFAALFRFFYERHVGEYRVRDNVLLCATGNRATDQAGAKELPSALANRFVHFELTCDYEEWVRWATQSSVDPLVIAFIRSTHGRMLHQFDATRGEVCFPSPRSVASASLLYQALESEPRLLLSALAGCCGDGWAAAFLTFSQLKEKIVPVEIIFASPDSAAVPQEIDVTYAVMSNVVCALARDATAEKLRASLRYASRIPEQDIAMRWVLEIVSLIRTDLYSACEEILTDMHRRFGRILIPR